MKNRLFVYVTLLITGLVALAIGAGILIDPREFHATLGIVVDEQASLTNEMRAAGGAIFAVGLFALCGVYWQQIASTALAVSALIFGSYGVARFYSFALDGIPNSKFLWVASLECVIAALCFAALAVVCNNNDAIIQRKKGIDS